MWGQSPHLRRTSGTAPRKQPSSEEPGGNARRRPEGLPHHFIGLQLAAALLRVTPRLAAGRTAGIEQFLFVPFDSFLYAVDILGYSFMSVATLFAAMVFTDKGVQRVARWFLISNGLLLPFLALQMYWHWLIWVAALWAVTFPGSMWSVAVLFRRAATTATRSTAASG